MISKLVKFYGSVDEIRGPQPSVGEVLREYGYKGHYEVVDNGSEFAGSVFTLHGRM